MGTLLGMVQVSSNLANPLVMIFTNIPKMKSMQPIIEKLKETANFPAALSRKGVPASCQNCICANELSFSYDGQKEVLSGVNCTIERGKKYVLVGKSGCGKSTLIKLLSGCYSTYRGEILYDKLQDLTLITVTHHLDEDLLKKYDKILYMENGYIKEEGAFESLISVPSRFAAYFQLKK